MLTVRIPAGGHYKRRQGAGLRCGMKTGEKLNMTMLCDFYELT